MLRVSFCAEVHLWFVVVYFFFFQAEDGIRDLVRSRGLGDVYKRQMEKINTSASPLLVFDAPEPENCVDKFVLSV